MDWGYLYSSFDGRISRKPYWLASIPLILIGLVLAGMQMAVSDGFTRLPSFGYRFGLFIVETALWYPIAALMVKRLHDRNRPGAYVWLLIGPALVMGVTELFGITSDPTNPTALDDAFGIFALIVLLLFLVELGFRRGTVGPNLYGPDPLEPLTASARTPAQIG